MEGNEDGTKSEGMGSLKREAHLVAISHRRRLKVAVKCSELMATRLEVRRRLAEKVRCALREGNSQKEMRDKSS